MNPVRRALVNAAIAIVVCTGVIVAAAALWFRSAVYGDRSLPAAAATVVVRRGDTLGTAAERLQAAGVLANPLAFRILARLRGSETAIQSGAYRFPAHQTTDEVLARLAAGRVEARWVTIPEGYTVREIARRLADEHLADAAAFEEYCRTHGITLDGERTPTLEGYLFPDTYLVPTGVPPADVARIFTDQFLRELPPDAGAAARREGLTLAEAMTMASLIEREAKADAERGLMAGVYLNRLRSRMPLQVDATIEYVFPEHHDTITRRDLAIDSPYNTYLHTGLPPTPIANPGKASIDAALAPVPSKYLFYVYKGEGRHAFARTLEEHESNVSRYLH